MPIQSETSRVQYAGNGSDITPYAVPFYFLANGDVAVVLSDVDGVETLLVENTDYLLTGAGEETGGEVLTVLPYGPEYSVAIYREPEALQLAEFQGTGPLPADTLTRGLDKLTMLVQSIQRKLLRSVRMTDAADDLGPVPGGVRAGRVVGFGSGGAVQMYDRTALLSLLSLQGGLQGAPTAFWSDDGERAAKLPEFTGQVGVQLDDLSLWVATAMTVGSWSPQVLDEDDLASNSDRQAPSQQSVKAYVDDGDAQAELAASDYADQQIKSYLPPGVVMPYAGATAPTGWLLCFGQEVSRATYADLFGVLSTTYGTGNGTTTFNLPDLRGRVVAGKDNMGGAAANRLTNSGTGNPGINGSVLGAAGGSDRHTLTVGQMPSHTHAPGVGIFLYGGAGAGPGWAGGGSYAPTTQSNTTAATGAGDAHPQSPPTLILNYIIRL